MAKCYIALIFLVLFVVKSAGHYVQGIIESILWHITLLGKGFKGLDYSKTKVMLNNGEYTGYVDNVGNFRM